MMNDTPLMVSPALAQKYGLEEALLLGVYLQLLNYVGQPSGEKGVHMLLTRPQWAGLVSFWDEKTHARVTARLVEQGVLSVEYRANEVYVRHEHGSLLQSSSVPAAAESVKQLPVRETPPPPPSQTSKRFVPFRTGKDELQQIFEQTEIEKQKRYPMTLDWKPSAQFYQLIKRFNIDKQFAQEQLDEFTLYWASRDRKESSWDQKFLNWVKKAQAFKQDAIGRNEIYKGEGAGSQHANGSSNSHYGGQHENARRDSKENRKRVTQAIMDIKDTDW